MSDTQTRPKSGDYVDIGDELGNLEEYIGDKLGTYVENGIIYAGTPGYLIIDEKKRKLTITKESHKKRTIPKKGDIVIGEVRMIRKSAVGVKIRMVKRNTVRRTSQTTPKTASMMMI